VGTTTPETLTITATVVSPVAQTNTATISAADQFDPNAGNNTASATETPQRADLALAKSVSDSTPNIGDTITFTVTLTNNGPDPATGVKVTDLLPTGLAFVSADPSQGSYTSGLWDVGTVTPGTPLTLEIVATVESDDAQTNTASITDTDQFDPITANDTAHSTVIPQQADLAVTKTVSNALPNVADTITFTITLTNNGPDTATGVVVNDVLPAGLAFVSATASRGAYNASTGVWTVNFVSMAEAVTLTIAATVVSAVAQTNTATIGAADQFDPNLANNTSSVTVTPLSADLQAIKTVNKPRVFVGAKVTFTVRIVNRGPGIARSVIVNELLPRGLVFVSARPSQGTFNRATRTWSVGNLASGDNATLQIVVRVRRPRANVNVAIVSAATVDPFLANNLGAAVVRGLRGISKRLFLARP
jgi:uncharacterized repeat protein (TIGR01451 family)